MTDLLLLIFRLYEVIVIVRVIVSWIQVDSYHPVIRFVHAVTEPVMAPIRNLLPTERIGIDFSPLIVLLLLEMIKNFLLRML